MARFEWWIIPPAVTVKAGKAMMNYILGFQSRVAPQKLKPWDTERRRNYLLRENIIVPLSVDIAVWPLSRNEELLFELFPNYSHDANGAPNGLNLFRLSSPLLTAHQSLYDDSYLIAISACSDVSIRLKKQHFIEDAAINIDDLERNGWTCLGYDVTDQWFYSGLMNCGYEEDQKATLSKCYSGDINEFGIFISEESAISFCSISNSRVPTHSPFFVCGVWVNGKP